jgi:hypothetical protein
MRLVAPVGTAAMVLLLHLLRQWHRHNCGHQHHCGHKDGQDGKDGQRQLSKAAARAAAARQMDEVAACGGDGIGIEIENAPGAGGRERERGGGLVDKDENIVMRAIREGGGSS